MEGLCPQGAFVKNNQWPLFNTVAASGSEDKRGTEAATQKLAVWDEGLTGGPFKMFIHSQNRNGKTRIFTYLGSVLAGREGKGGAVNLERWCCIQGGLQQKPAYKAFADIRQLLYSHEPSVKGTEQDWSGCVHQRMLVQEKY